MLSKIHLDRYILDRQTEVFIKMQMLTVEMTQLNKYITTQTVRTTLYKHMVTNMKITKISQLVLIGRHI